MRIALLLMLLLHGIIHFMGFAKAFHYGNVAQFAKEISKPMGLLWLLTGLLFIVSTGLNMMKRDTWPILAMIAVLVSQILIFTVWRDAKFGTIANFIILLAAIIGFASSQFENKYKGDVRSAIEKSKTHSEIITARDLERLPLPVKKYLVYVGVVGKPKINNVCIVLKAKCGKRERIGFRLPRNNIIFSIHPPAFSL